MLAVPGYTHLQVLYEGRNSRIYRATAISTRRPVILKMLWAEYPTPHDIARLRYQYMLLQSLDHPGIIKAYALESSPTLILVMEDSGGHALRHFLNAGAMDLETVLDIAIAICDCLDYLQQQQIMHHDIKPDNIIYNPVTGHVQLIDFGSASRLAVETHNGTEAYPIHGTLAYMAPEATGRMNRAVDYRSDFYSLGVTLYELLSGQLPFIADAPLNLVHAHIAIVPPSLTQLVPHLPPVIAAIVDKLLAKAAEDRYQSAFGIKVDLEACLQQWRTTNTITEFPIATIDISSQFQLAQRIYGRDQEVEALVAALTRVSHGSTECLLVTGPAGIGKTTLIAELQAPIVERHGYFISGKFDQLQRVIPYSALLQAFRMLIQHLLTESEQQISTWRERLLKTLHPNAQVIIEVIPELVRILGPQPAVPALGAQEEQNRFNFVFRAFLEVFPTAEHPLVLFLDDLQWADQESLQLLKVMLSAKSGYFLLIGAFRENEVSASHPLLAVLDELRRAAIPMHQLHLEPLAFTDVMQFVSDTIRVPLKEAESLAQAVATKTASNPLFVRLLLSELHRTGVLTFDRQRQRWDWDLLRLQHHSGTENVIDLLTTKIQQLPPETQRVLRIAACLGNQFDLNTIAAVTTTPLHEVGTILWPALATGLIIPRSKEYKYIEFVAEAMGTRSSIEYQFVHDRVQQAAYELIPPPERPQVHRLIGEALLALAQDYDTPRLFDIVDHLNMSREMLPDQAARDDLARRNLRVARNAYTAAAYAVSGTYAQIGLELLGPGAWDRCYDMALALHTLLTEMAFLTLKLDLMEVHAQAVIKHAHTPLEQVPIYVVLIQAAIAQSQLESALDLAFAILNTLGIRFPTKPTPPHVIAGLLKTKLLLGRKPILSLLDLPSMTDPYASAAMQIMSRILTASFFVSEALFPLVVFTMVQLSLRYGNSSESAFAYSTYGASLCGVVGDIEAGHQFGQLAMRLEERLPNRRLHAATASGFYGLVNHWKAHPRESLAPLLTAHRIGLETGDFEFAAHTTNHYIWQSFYIGTNLADLAMELLHFVQVTREIQQTSVVGRNRMYLQAVTQLLDPACMSCHLRGPHYDEQQEIPFLQAARDKTSLAYLYTIKLVLAYLFESYDQAMLYATEAKPYLDALAVLETIRLYYFYDSLARLAHGSSADAAMLRQVAKNQRKLHRWSKHAPQNNLHKWHLVEAERARVLQQHAQAHEHYSNAIAFAHKHGYLHEEALAYELAGKYYLQRGQEKIARLHLSEAYYCYTQWGAAAKTKQLERTYSAWLPPVREQAATRPTNIHASSTYYGNSDELDLASMLKAAGTISSELQRESLFTTLMRIVTENAGAHRAVFVAPQGQDFFITAIHDITTGISTSDLALPIAQTTEAPITIIQFTARTQEDTILDDATSSDLFAHDSYVRRHQCKSVLCVPLRHQGRLVGVLYLENRTTTGVFTAQRVAVVQLLAAQAAISLTNIQAIELRLQNTQLEGLLQFARFVQHELRGHVAGLEGLLPLLHDAIGAQPELPDVPNSTLLGAVHECVEGIDELSLQLLVLTREEQLPTQQVRIIISDLLAQAQERAQITATRYQSDTTIVIEGGEGLELDGNSVYVALALFTAVRNAVEALADQEGPQQIWLRAGYDGEVWLRVEDSGPGFPPDLVQRVMLAQSTERGLDIGWSSKVGGSGLGLPLLDRVARLHGGRFKIGNREAGGAWVELRFAEKSP